jgi:DNA-binding SARP family transcriptional activator/Tol biopolymer transport system component
MEYRILGPLEIWDGDHALALRGLKPRALLADLLIHGGEVLSTDRLIDDLWGESPPDTALSGLQVYVSKLRKLLGTSEGSSLVTRPPGYVLQIRPGDLDLHLFERLAEQGRQALAEQDAARASARFGEALNLYRGEPLSDFAYEPFAQATIERLKELKLSVVEERIDANLALGRHRELIPELEAVSKAHPLRERLRCELMLALYRSGRQADALAVYQQARAVLADELGIDPGPELRRLEKAILEQDAEIEWVEAERTAPRAGVRAERLPVRQGIDSQGADTMMKPAPQLVRQINDVDSTRMQRGPLLDRALEPISAPVSSRRRNRRSLARFVAIGGATMALVLLVAVVAYQSRADNHPAKQSRAPDHSPLAIHEPIGRISYTNGTDIASVPAVGGASKTVATDLVSPSRPAWSSIPGWLAYSAAKERAGSGLYLKDATQAAFRMPTPTVRAVGAPAWSADGTKVAFWGEDAVQSLPRLYVCDLEAGSQHAVLDGSTFGFGSAPLGTVSWSPDGRNLAFSPGLGIWVVAANGANSKKVSAVGEFPAWSPNGRVIAFDQPAVGGEGQRDIELLNLSTGRVTPLDQSAADDSHPSWSPDGSWIALSRDAGGEHLIMEEPLVDPSQARTLVRATGGATLVPSWRPKSRGFSDDSGSARTVLRHALNDAHTFYTAHNSFVGFVAKAADAIDPSITFGDEIYPSVPGLVSIRVANKTQVLLTFRALQYGTICLGEDAYGEVFQGRVDAQTLYGCHN